MPSSRNLMFVGTGLAKTNHTEEFRLDCCGLISATSVLQALKKYILTFPRVPVEEAGDCTLGFRTLDLKPSD